MTYLEIGLTVASVLMTFASMYLFFRSQKNVHEAWKALELRKTPEGPRHEREVVAAADEPVAGISLLPHQRNVEVLMYPYYSVKSGYVSNVSVVNMLDSRRTLVGDSGRQLAGVLNLGLSQDNKALHQSLQVSNLVGLAIAQPSLDVEFSGINYLLVESDNAVRSERNVGSVSKDKVRARKSQLAGTVQSEARAYGYH